MNIIITIVYCKLHNMGLFKIIYIYIYIYILSHIWYILYIYIYIYIYNYIKYTEYEKESINRFNPISIMSTCFQTAVTKTIHPQSHMIYTHSV